MASTVQVQHPYFEYSYTSCGHRQPLGYAAKSSIAAQNAANAKPIVTRQSEASFTSHHSTPAAPRPW